MYINAGWPDISFPDNELSVPQEYTEGHLPYRGGKKGRIERLRKRLDAKKVEIYEFNLAFNIEGKILCNACALKRGADFVFSNDWLKVSLDDFCFVCEKTIKEANTEESELEIFCMWSLRDTAESEM